MIDLATVRSGGIRGVLQELYDERDTPHEIQAKVRAIMAGGAIKSSSVMFDQFIGGRPVSVDAVVHHLEVDAEALEVLAATLRALVTVVKDNPGAVDLGQPSGAGLSPGLRRTW